MGSSTSSGPPCATPAEGTPAGLAPTREASGIDVVEAPRDLAEVIVRDCLVAVGRVRVRLTGRCMRPALEPGDVVVIAPPDQQPLRLGDVVLTRQASGLRLHRLLWRPVLGCGCWLTAADRGRWDAPVAARDVLGAVVAVEGRAPRPPSRARWWRTAALSTARELRGRLGLGPGLV